VRRMILKCGLEPYQKAKANVHAAPGGPPRAITRLLDLLLIGFGSMVTVFWAIRAFATHSSLASDVSVTGMTSAVILALVSAHWILSRNKENATGLHQVAAAAISPAVVFAVYLPEYLLGGRVAMSRSLVLVALVVSLSALLWRVADQKPLGSETTLRQDRVALTLFGIGLGVYFIVITALSLRKLATLGYAGQDLAYFSQIFYTTLHGKLLYSNFYQDLLYTRTVYSDFAGHNSPIQFLFVAFYRIWPSPAMNLVIRDLFMTLSAIPAYLLARIYLRPGFAVSAALMFLCVPAIFFQNLFEFYPFSLAAFFLLFAFWNFARGNLQWFMISLFALLLVREDLVFAAFFFGVLALWRRRKRAWVLIPVALSVFWAYLSWRVVLPHFLMGAPYRSNVCFAHLGNDAPSMLATVLHHPGATILTRDNIIYLKQLMTPFGGILPWMSPAALGAVPYLAINLLGGAGECPTTSVFSQHSVVPTVFLYVGFLWTLRKICEYGDLISISSRKIASAGLAIAFALTLADLAFASYPEQFHELAQNPVRSEVDQLAGLVPAQAAVAVPRYMAPLFADRMTLYMTDDLLDYHHPNPEYVIVDRDFVRMRRSLKWRVMYDRVKAELARRPDMTLIYESANYLVYQRSDITLSLPVASTPGASPSGRKL
jgi:uncharacterized membrane protein